MRTGGKTGGKRSAEPRVPPPPTLGATTPYLPSNNAAQQQKQQQQQHQQQQRRSSEASSASHKIDLSKFRALVRSYIDRGHYETAIFWADKISTLSGGDPKDIYWMANALYQV